MAVMRSVLLGTLFIDKSCYLVFSSAEDMSRVIPYDVHQIQYVPLQSIE